jgi:hypothetical protein
MKSGSKIRSRAVRTAAVLALGVLLALPAAASSPMAGERGHYRGQCKRLTKQIDHYENQVLPLAIERGNRAWERATNQQVERLWNRRADLCPEYGAQRTFLAKTADAIRRFNKLVVAAGRAAAAYFTGGLAGP